MAVSRQKKKLLKTTSEQVQNALEAVKIRMPVGGAAKAFNFPRITLLYKANGKVPENCRMGAHTEFDFKLQRYFSEMNTTRALNQSFVSHKRPDSGQCCHVRNRNEAAHSISLFSTMLLVV